MLTCLQTGQPQMAIRELLGKHLKRGVGEQGVSSLGRGGGECPGEVLPAELAPL